MTRNLVASIAIALALVACGGSGSGANGAVDARFGLRGLDTRAGLIGLNIPTGDAGSPVRAVDAFPNLRLPDATFITHAGDRSNRLFVTERLGVIRVFANDAATSQAPVFMDLGARVDGGENETGLLGLAFDPAFASNGYFYVTYVVPGAVTGGERRMRLSRFRASGNSGDAASEKVVLEFAHPNGYHFGGWIGWGRDGMLYMSSGDGGNAELAQSPTGNLFGKILRLRIDSAAGTYSVPADNPFAGSLTWAYGLRNPWRCSFDRADGRLWCGDVGELSREEVNLVVRGGNYGWPFFEGDRPFMAAGSRAYEEFEAPLFTYGHDVGAAVIGGYVYRGSRVPQLQGRYLYSDYVNPSLWSIEIDAGGAFVAQATAAEGTLPDVQSFGEDEAGEVHAVSAVAGVVYRFEPGNGRSVPMPDTLSATGLFIDTANLEPAPFMIDYSVNAPFWSDGATKRRWLVVPDSQRIGFSATAAWSFPVGTITVKHFDLPQVSGDLTRLETRVMVHRSDGWVGYTYVWRADQSDADLVTRGSSGVFDTVDPATGQAAQVSWQFPGQAQCLRCHTQAAGRVLGLNTAQLNRDHTYRLTDRSDNQLLTLAAIDVLDGEIGDVAQQPALPDPRDGNAPVEARARAWLDANCANCHRPGGPTPVDMDLRHATPLAEMRLAGEAARAGGALRVAPGDHAASLLWQRAGATDQTQRMPPLGTSRVDAEALRLLAAWIDAMR